MSVYRVAELIATRPTSWEDTADLVHDPARQHVGNRRVAESP